MEELWEQGEPRLREWDNLRQDGHNSGSVFGVRQSKAQQIAVHKIDGMGHHLHHTLLLLLFVLLLGHFYEVFLPPHFE